MNPKEKIRFRPLIMLYAVDYDGRREDVLASPMAGTELFGAEILDPLVDDKKRALVLLTLSQVPGKR